MKARIDCLCLQGKNAVYVQKKKNAISDFVFVNMAVKQENVHAKTARAANHTNIIHCHAA